MRQELLSDIVNRSISQTLSRTILTARLTFRCVGIVSFRRRGVARVLVLRW